MEDKSADKSATKSSPAATGAPILLPFDQAVIKLGTSNKHLEHLAQTLAIRCVEIDGQLFFTEEALRDWVARNERRVW
jgi:hypothetical protein